MAFRSEKGFFTLISILITVGIVCFVIYSFFKTSGKSLLGNNNTSSYSTMVDDTRKQINNYNSKQIQELQEYTNITSQ